MAMAIGLVSTCGLSSVEEELSVGGISIEGLLDMSSVVVNDQTSPAYC